MHFDSIFFKLQYFLFNKMYTNCPPFCSGLSPSKQLSPNDCLLITSLQIICLTLWHGKTLTLVTDTTSCSALETTILISVFSWEFQFLHQEGIFKESSEILFSNSCGIFYIFSMLIHACMHWFMQKLHSVHSCVIKMVIIDVGFSCSFKTAAH